MHDFDRNSGIIFYSQVGVNGLGCWNSNTQHLPQNFENLARNDQTMIYPSDLNVSVTEHPVNERIDAMFTLHICFRLIMMEIYGCSQIQCQDSFMLN